MEQIEFNKSSNVFVNTGIIALYRYLKKLKTLKSNFENLKFELQKDKLVIEHGNILEFLEEVYYIMGDDIYNTASAEQKRKAENAYYDEEKDTFYRFPRMNTLGLTALLTNNAQGTTRKKESSPKLADLEKINPEKATKIKEFYKDSNLKIGKKVYLNEPYSKITSISLEKKYFEEGDLVCPILGESFKELTTGQNISPFLSGLGNFNSFLDSSDRKISLKAIYVVRFSPALAMFTYYNMYDSISCSFFSSTDLISINELYETGIFYTKDQMEAFKIPFQKNVQLYNFRYAKKDGGEYELGGGNESYSPIEITFLILYTFYKRKFSTGLSIEEMDDSEFDIFEGTSFENKPISVITFKADKFASTMRPNFFEEYSNVKLIIRLCHLLETNEKLRIPINELWRGLIFRSQKSETIKDFTKKQRNQRFYRESFLKNLLSAKSNLDTVQDLFSKAYLRLSGNEDTGFRRYDILTEFLIIYEPLIKFGGINMDKNLQQRAINLGKSIGQSILNYESPKNPNEKKANAKNGRKYIIGLNKSRTIDQFRVNIIRIQQKYGVSVANDILENLDEKNYQAIKQYAIIGALNTLNTVLSSQNQ